MRGNVARGHDRARLVPHDRSPARRPAAPAARQIERNGKPDIVLILTDDQRFDTLDAMPQVNELLVRPGMRFENAFVVNPLCCPSRATILTGKYSHSTGVYTNQWHDGYSAFDSRRTVATALDKAGYRTALFGKYFNGYKGERVPEGWDRWFATFGPNSAYYSYRARDDGKIRRFGTRPSDYGTTVVRHQATSFIRSVPRGKPLFMVVAPHAPHSPATAAPQDVRAFGGLPRFDGPSYGESDVSDKPPYIRALPPFDAQRVARIEVFRRQQLRALLGIDRLVASVVKTLEDTGRLHNTLVVFTSDNGFMWGEHRYRTKNAPYEESIRVPMVMRFDSAGSPARIDSHLVANVDLTPTFVAAAGAHLPGMEGKNLLRLFRSPSGGWRHAFLVEHVEYQMERGSDTPVPTYCMIRTERYAYVHYADSFRELYDMRADPAQLENLAGDRAYGSTVRRLESRLRELCRPRPPGFSWA